jgi:hypothetical protein
MKVTRIKGAHEVDDPELWAKYPDKLWYLGLLTGRTVRDGVDFDTAEKIAMIMILHVGWWEVEL